MSVVSFLPRATRVAFASAARTASANSAEIVLGNYYSGVIVSIDATAITATPSVTFSIQVLTPQGDWVSVLTSAAVTAAGDTLLYAGPNIATTANVSANIYLPNRIRIAATHADADSITYSVQVILIP